MVVCTDRCNIEGKISTKEHLNNFADCPRKNIAVMEHWSSKIFSFVLCFDDGGVSYHYYYHHHHLRSKKILSYRLITTLADLRHIMCIAIPHVQRPTIEKQLRCNQDDIFPALEAKELVFTHSRSCVYLCMCISF